MNFKLFLILVLLLGNQSISLAAKIPKFNLEQKGKSFSTVPILDQSTLRVCGGFATASFLESLRNSLFPDSANKTLHISPLWLSLQIAAIEASGQINNGDPNFNFFFEHISTFNFLIYSLQMIPDIYLDESPSDYIEEDGKENDILYYFYRIQPLYEILSGSIENINTGLKTGNIDNLNKTFDSLSLKLEHLRADSPYLINKFEQNLPIYLNENLRANDVYVTPIELILETTVSRTFQNPFLHAGMIIDYKFFLEDETVLPSQYVNSLLRRQRKNSIGYQPFLVEFCSSYLLDSTSVVNVFENPDHCKLHAAVLTGIKRKKGITYFQIRNSWGDMSSTIANHPLLEQGTSAGSYWIPQSIFDKTVYKALTVSNRVN